MLAEIIAIGDELTSGQRLDTNSRWLAQQLGELGVRTIQHTTVGDDLSRNEAVFQAAAERADVAVCTGGLGPTLDDLTRQALANAFELPLELDPVSLERIEALFASRHRAMPERNRCQAMFPQGSRPVPNPHGSAPGIDLDVKRGDRSCRFFCLPGVPAEMKQMWVESVVPSLEASLGSEEGSLYYHAVKVFGIGESDVEVRLPQLIDRQRRPAVGITVSRATITLRIAARALDAEAFDASIQPTIREIESALGDLVFGSGDEELQDVVVRRLLEQNLKMASIEIGSASWISDWMLGASGEANSCYRGGLAFPDVVSACRWLEPEFSQHGLGLERPQAILDMTKDETESLWTQLAQLAMKRLAADVVLVAGVYPTQKQMESSQEPFEFRYALAKNSGIEFSNRRMGGHPDVLGPRVAKTGLDLVRRAI